MFVFYSNGMFILALVAVSILGVICFGLLIVLALIVLNKKREKEPQINLSSIADSPPPSPSHSKNAEKPQLTVSDWVDILINEKFGWTDIVLSISVVFISLLVLIYTAITITAWNYIAVAVFVGGLSVIYIKLLDPARKKTKDAKEILNDILYEKFKNEAEIRKAWLERQKPEEEE